VSDGLEIVFSGSLRGVSHSSITLSRLSCPLQSVFPTCQRSHHWQYHSSVIVHLAKIQRTVIADTTIDTGAFRNLAGVVVLAVIG
jgi:hypothetical protein